MYLFVSGSTPSLPDLYLGQTSSRNLNFPICQMGIHLLPLGAVAKIPNNACLAPDQVPGT